jgi:signal transduction histidine kinase
MEGRGRTVSRAACLLVVLASLCPWGAWADGEARWRVVIIRNWDSLYPVNVVREAALRQALQENASRVVEIYPEELDPLRFPSGLMPEMVPVLREKYRDTHIDVVIASGREPHEFAAKTRDLIWPGAAIVFHGVIEGVLDGWTHPPRTTGLIMDLDVEGTLRIGHALVPGAKRVYLIAGNSRFDEDFLRLAQKQMARAALPLDSELIVGGSRAEVLERVAQVDRESLVLYLTILRDSSGQIAAPGSNGIGRIARQSRAPVLSAVHTQWRRGPVGGSSARFDEHGREAGLLARRVLEGEDPDKLPIVALPRPVCELDWTALQRWAIPERNIPPGCRVVNRPPGTWEQHAWTLGALAVVIVAQGLLIWMLVLQSRRRHIAEAQLKARGAELARVARLSTLGALTASIAHEINQPMGAILGNAEAAEMMLARGELDPEKLREILEDIRNEDLRASEVIAGLRKLLAQRESRPSAIEVNTEVAEGLRHVAFEATQRGVTLTPEFDRALPPVLGDGVQVQQVVINLVMNAIEAVSELPEQRREVRVTTHACSDGVQIQVADRGPGVAPEDEQRLFDSMFTRKKDGMGLGLSIVRAIIESFGGRVRYEHNVPYGAIFHVWLPAMGR